MTFAEENNSTAFHSLMSAGGSAAHCLPVLTTAADVREFVLYLKLKPNGVVAAEEIDRPKKRLFDDRKLLAYELLGLTISDGSNVRLSSRGWDFAKSFEFDVRAFRLLLSQNEICQSVLAWINDQKIEMVTAPEVVSFWREVQPETFSEIGCEELKAAVVSFFSFCQGATLGTMTLGKRGHITRFCVDRNELLTFLREKPGLLGADHLSEVRHEPKPLTSQAQFKVLIQGENQAIVETVQETLKLLEIDNEFIEASWSDLYPSATFARVDNLQESALLSVLGEDSFNTNSSEQTSLKEKVLLGLGAAHILFRNRVVLLVDKRMPVAEGLKDLNCFEFNGQCLDWKVGLELGKVFNEMRGAKVRIE